MKEAFIWCYPWDLEEEGLDSSLARISGELGLDAISVAATHGDIAELRSRYIAPNHSFVTTSGVAFQPDAGRYSGSRIRPHAAPWLKSRNPLARIAEAAERHRLALRLNMVCNDMPAIVQRHPHAACVNVFGNASGRWMCPSNPDAREFLAALVEDLSANYPARTIELEAFAFSPRRLVDYHASRQPDDDTARALMSWCFCAACRQRARDAGIDADALVANIRERIIRQTEAPAAPTTTFNAYLAEQPQIAAFIRLRAQVIASLVEALRTRARKRLILHHSPMAQREGIEPSLLDSHCDGWITAPPSTVSRAQLTGIDMGRREAAFFCWPPMCKDGPALVSAVHEASQAGCPAVGFAHYGAAPLASLEWIRQAVRYARREAY